MSDELEKERVKTRGLFLRFNSIAVLLPCASLALIYLYTVFTHSSWGKAEWKIAVFCIWLGTLLALIREGLRAGFSERHYRRKWKRSQNRPGELDTDDGQAVLRRWENKNTFRILRELFVLSIFLPITSISITWLYFFLLGQTVSRSQWKTGVFCLWVGLMICLLRLGWRQMRVQMVHRDG